MLDPVQFGIERFRANEFERAVAAFNVAIELNPDDRYAHWNKATALLSLGNYRDGFAEYEWAWRLFRWHKFDCEALPLWDGRPAARLLVYHEQGHGDAIMAFRFLPALARRCRSLALVVDPALARLAHNNFGVPVASAVPDGLGDDLGDFDCRLPLFGVMRALGVTVDTVPREPYLGARFQRQRRTLGICWSGETQTTFTAERFVAMLGAPAKQKLFALKPGGAPQGVEPLAAGDFWDTARLLETLDHVVTVDTAVAHLAGAMGHPSAHVVLPFVSDWFWWHVGAWYPRLNIYRQRRPGDDWSSPFAELRLRLFH